MKTFIIKTFGCQANKSDSERIAGDYVARGYKQASDWRQADEIVINTCSVRQRAEDRVKGFLINVQKYFEQNPQKHPPSGRPKIILTGCMLHHPQKTLRSLLPQIDEILHIGEVGFNSPAIRKDKLHAFVPISSGCNSFCSYCIVPYSRGREKSRPKQNILKEIQELVQNGYREITLLGQNVNSYGLEKTGVGLRKLLLQNKLKRADLPSNQSAYLKPDTTPPFVDLLKQISTLPQIKKIRFFTANPWDFYPELIDEIATNPKTDRFIHLPVQSGSNKILKLMNRGYTAKDYLNLIRKIKHKIPDAVFGTDIIVGFPGETEADFQATVNLVKKVGFKLAFVAQYSPRPGTAAYRLYSDDVSAPVKKKRWQILENLINQPNLKTRPIIK